MLQRMQFKKGKRYTSKKTVSKEAKSNRNLMPEK